MLDIDNERYRKIIKNNQKIFSLFNERMKVQPFLYVSILLKKKNYTQKNKKNVVELQLQIKKLYENVDTEKLKNGGLNL